MARTLDALLTDLEAAKNDFSPNSSAKVKALVQQISSSDIRDSQSLVRFHEALLFFRAFPPALQIVSQTERLLDSFRKRVETIRDSGADMSYLDDFDTSGISGTVMQDALTFEAARWVSKRIPQNVEIAWDDYDEERAMSATWPRFMPLLEEDADVEANIPWRRWLDAARGGARDLKWLIRCFEKLPVATRERAELYDSLRIPLRWKLEDLTLSRTKNWTRPRKFFLHSGPLITRKEVSLKSELGQPYPDLKRLSLRQGERVMRLIREVMLVRYRELYGTTLGDPRSVLRAEIGRGVVMYFWNLPPERRLPVRAYVAGFTVKNGVPINYIEAIGLCEWIEVGFNTFYTYRQGETAWIYAQALRCLCAMTGATTISVYPYQIGQNNDEALDSGAFWFYRKLGFRSGNPKLEQLARREESRIAANPEYRTSRQTLKRLAEAHVFYEVPATGKTIKTKESSGPWDSFSTRNLGLRVNHRMAREFDGDAVRIQEVSLSSVIRSLALNPAGWSMEEKRCLQNWSLVLAMIPRLADWARDEKRALAQTIRAQAGPNEMAYLRRTQRHKRLCEELLCLGSK